MTSSPLRFHLQMPEQDELLWDDGSAQPEWCLDQFNLVGRVRHPGTHRMA